MKRPPRRIAVVHSVVLSNQASSFLCDGARIQENGCRHIRHRGLYNDPHRLWPSQDLGRRLNGTTASTDEVLDGVVSVTEHQSIILDNEVSRFFSGCQSQMAPKPIFIGLEVRLPDAATRGPTVFVLGKRGLLHRVPTRKFRPHDPQWSMEKLIPPTSRLETWYYQRHWRTAAVLGQVASPFALAGSCTLYALTAVRIAESPGWNRHLKSV